MSARQRTVWLTPSEADATDGHLCWRDGRPQRFRPNRACSLPFPHVWDGTPCRFDMDIRIPAFTKDRMLRVALPTFLVSLVLGVFLTVAIP